MNLSEAIRLGAMLRPNQAFGVLFDPADPTATCAMGAAAEAIGALDVSRRGKYTEDKDQKIPACWRFLQRLYPLCPACGADYAGVSGTLRHLNNDHKWTREQIADWVATLEPQEPHAVSATDACREPVAALR